MTYNVFSGTLNPTHFTSPRWKYRTQKIAIGAPSHNFGYIFVTKACIENRKKTC